MLEQIVSEAPFFLIVAARCLALVLTLPLFSMRTISRSAKIALVGYMAYFIVPQVDFSPYAAFIDGDAAFTINFVLIIIGEALIGVINGFYVTIIFAAFSTAGQFFAFQMGFSASEVYDSMSQVENPLMGQYFNLIAMLIFLQGQWVQRLFFEGLLKSFKSINCFMIITESARGSIVHFMMSGLTDLFIDALIISLPLMGILLLISISVGLLSKAAPQMNLLSEGFPIMMMLSFFMITALMPTLCDFFGRSFFSGFKKLESLFIQISGGGL